jgi:hypothetical protein
MKDAQKPDHVSLNTLIQRLREGRYVIPDFQREFEWKPWDISDLMRSIFSDYYIGSLLLWKGKATNFDALSCEPVYGYNGADGQREYIVLDGQQRLTAMYYAFIAPDRPLPNRANRYYYYIRIDRLMADDVDKAFEYEWSSNQWKALMANAESQYAKHIFPLSVIGDPGLFTLSNWIQGYQNYWKDHRAKVEATEDTTEQSLQEADTSVRNAEKFGELVAGIIGQYQVSYNVLDQELEIEKVCDIFTKLNSTGVQLDTFDLINALLKPKGLQLKKMWRDASERLSFVETEKMNTYILQVMSILCQWYCSPKYLYYLLPGHEKSVRGSDGAIKKEVLIKNTEDFRLRWDQAVGALEGAINLLKHPQEFGAISTAYLPYVSILPAFAALQSIVKSQPASQQLDAQRKLRHWYWASVFLNRYSGSVESTTARDVLDLRDWFNNNDAQPGFIQEFQDRFRTLDLRRETKKGSSIYNGIFNLLVTQGARDWMTGNVPQHGDLDDHHIIPASKLPDLGQGVQIHSILNRTPLTSDTNRKVISDRWPYEYLPDLMEQSGEETVRSILESHFISPLATEILLRSPFTAADFEAFISERNRTLFEAIENLLIKERIDLSPQLRDLDARIERIELDLRLAISTTLDGDESRLPPHVRQKLDERIQGALKKNAALGPDSLKTLSQRLEYADIRELQDTIQSNSLWSLFQSVFLNKDALTTKFGQLADIRNGIRHSRAITEITRKEGEAAILWFEQVLGK